MDDKKDAAGLKKAGMGQSYAPKPMPKPSTKNPKSKTVAGTGAGLATKPPKDGHAYG